MRLVYRVRDDARPGQPRREQKGGGGFLSTTSEREIALDVFFSEAGSKFPITVPRGRERWRTTRAKHEAANQIRPGGCRMHAAFPARWTRKAASTQVPRGSHCPGDGAGSRHGSETRRDRRQEASASTWARFTHPIGSPRALRWNGDAPFTVEQYRRRGLKLPSLEKLCEWGVDVSRVNQGQRDPETGPEFTGRRNRT